MINLFNGFTIPVANIFILIPTFHFLLSSVCLNKVTLLLAASLRLLCTHPHRLMEELLWWNSCSPDTRGGCKNWLQHTGFLLQDTGTLKTKNPDGFETFLRLNRLKTSARANTCAGALPPSWLLLGRLHCLNNTQGSNDSSSSCCTVFMPSFELFLFFSFFSLSRERSWTEIIYGYFCVACLWTLNIIKLSLHSTSCLFVCLHPKKDIKHD